jgi:hypothetical protein
MTELAFTPADISYPVFVRVLEGGVPVEGAEPVLTVTNEAGHQLDFADYTFKAANWVADALPLLHTFDGYYTGVVDLYRIVGLGEGDILTFDVTSPSGVVQSVTNAELAAGAGVPPTGAAALPYGPRGEAVGGVGAAVATALQSSYAAVVAGPRVSAAGQATAEPASSTAIQVSISKPPRIAG